MSTTSQAGIGADTEKGEMRVVGKRIARVDGGERVTGRAIYPADLQRPGMAIGAVKRSNQAHARIVKIDTSRARALKGVLAVITAADFPVVKPGTIYPFGETGADAWISAITVMARDKVLWRGHPVAAVAAVDAHVAAEALELIDVTYEALPPLMDIAAATAADAVAIMGDHKPKGFDADKVPPPNVGGRTLIARGDTSAAFASAAATADLAMTIDTAHQG